MILKEIVIENFRVYRNRHRIPIDDLTAFIGKNDAGKSSVFDALAVFFEHPLGKIDGSDVCVHAGDGAELRIGCVFADFPDSITIDETSETTLADEYLLNGNGDLEIHKVFDFSGSSLKKPRIVAVAEHPTAEDCADLLSKKNADLKKIGEQAGIDEEVDRRSNVALRKAIWAAADDLRLREVGIQLNKEEGKAIWERLSGYLPEYALFRADRPSTDEDSEVQDPLKVAIRQAMEEVEEALDAVKHEVREKTLDVANRTIEKLAEFDDSLASKLRPDFKTEPKWDGLFKLSLTGDDDIPVNKRGSGVRRLILFSFFMAEAERLREKREKGNIVYAVEEPETSQHPDSQRKVVEALRSVADSDGHQVMLTTHVPAIASLLPVDRVRYVRPHEGEGCEVLKADGDVLRDVVSSLGILPDGRARVLVCVEGPNDLRFLERINRTLREADDAVIDLFGDPRVAFVVLGGNTLREWVNRHYLKNLGLPEVHIYDRDLTDESGKCKYQAAADEVNARNDGSVAFFTEKREMENYLHLDAVNEVLEPIFGFPMEFDLTDDCDVESEIKRLLDGREKICRRSVKRWLNEDVAERMTPDRLRERGGYDEIRKWFEEIAKRIWDGQAENKFRTD